MTLSDRINIEKGILEGKSFRQIAKSIGKDPSTVSKEVKKHSRITERKKSIAETPIPCARRKGCTVHDLCDRHCDIQCQMCKRPGFRCSDICDLYEPRKCPRLERPPYVCNGCAKRSACLMEMRVYSSKYADDEYRSTLITSREGINQTPETIQRINDLITPLVKKGQSIAHIYATHAEELSCSRKTIYTYVNQGIFDIANIDMRRVVKYKKRKTATRSSAKDRTYRKGHNYDDFKKVLSKSGTINVVEMDTVEGKHGGKVLMTMLFRSCNLMLIFLLNRKTQSEVKRIFDDLTGSLGEEVFESIFPVILTDGGVEFSDREALEVSDDGVRRTTIYYCDPYSSWQKGAIEKNHEYIRYVIPKGKSMNGLTDNKVKLMMNHINSEKRDSLNGHSPFELSQLLLDHRLHEVLGLESVPPDEVDLTPELIK